MQQATGRPTKGFFTTDDCPIELELHCVDVFSNSCGLVGTITFPGG
jgi:hypothetical protein